jgi:hypothetical protein
MLGPPQSVDGLRRLLSERFPPALSRSAAVLRTETPALDEPGGGGLPLGAITEVVSLQPSSGGQLLILKLLEITRLQRSRVALIDGIDAFDPRSHQPAGLEHLVWVRCHTLDETMHAADILAHDANLALVMLDLRGFTVPELRRVPASTWYRLQRAIERSDTALLVLTTQPLVSSAVLRLNLCGAFTLADLDALQPDLVHALPAEVQRNRLQLERRSA